jgi:hypothetical protein
VGESKRRKDSDPDYGRNKPIEPSLFNCCNSVLAQESAFLLLDFWSKDAGGVVVGAIDRSKFDSTQEFSFQVATQQAFLDLGVRRQCEQSLGCMGLMDRTFRKELGYADFDTKHSFIFNWLSIKEIDKALEENSRQRKGRRIVFDIIKYLVEKCDPNHQFPCWFSGIRSEETEAPADLIFMCDRRRPSETKIDTSIDRENYS